MLENDIADLLESMGVSRDFIDSEINMIEI